MKNLKDKIVLVCGGGSGIGAATARRLSEEGARVAVADLNEDTALALATECADGKGFQYDQADAGSIEKLVSEVVGHFGGLDAVFANVADLGAVLEDGDLLANGEAMWQRTLQVNVTGTALLIKASLPYILERGGGSVVVTSSSASSVGEPERVAYAASKAGVEAICRHIASKWGKQGIRANAIAPGLIVTPQLQAGMGQETLDYMLRGVRGPRHGAPEDIAAAVAFLMSDDGAFVNGQVWQVNGGVDFSK